jgi:hypothetical protein
MNTALWIIQIILALLFSMAGTLKTTQPIDTLIKTVTWADRFPLSVVRFIGLMELLGAAGIILPWSLRIIPILTPLSASGLAMIQFFAIFHHALHKEVLAIAANITLLTLSIFVVVGRFAVLLN